MSEREAGVLLRGFPGGPRQMFVPTETLELLWRLEEKGYDPRVVAGQFVVTTSTLTTEQREIISRWKKPLVAIVRYCEQVP